MSKNLIGPLCHERNPHDLDFLLHLDNNCGPTHLSSQSSFFVETKKKTEIFLARKVVCLLLLAPLLEPLCCKLDFVPNLLRCVGPCTTDLAEVSL